MSQLRSTMNRAVFVATLNLMGPSLSLADGCTVSSGGYKVATLQLYTSEGCSSCPPADKWLSGLDARGFKPDQVIPLAFHVDYWDYIGWNDVYAKPVFSAFQQRQASLRHSSFLYTPQVLLNGEDYRDWSNSKQFQESIAAINRSPARARVQLTVSPVSLDTVEVSVTSQTADRQSAVLYVAMFENKIASQVLGGENSGKLLRHDYVVRELLGPFPLDITNSDLLKRRIPINGGWKIKNLGIAAFIQNPANGEMLQAVSTNMDCSK